MFARSIALYSVSMAGGNFKPQLTTPCQSLKATAGHHTRIRDRQIQTSAPFVT